MADIDYLAHLEAEAGRFSSLLRDADRARPIAACPGWTTADLAVHLGAVHRWATDNVRRAGEPPQGRSRIFAISPDEPDLAGWYDEGAATLLDTLRSTPPDAPSWSWGRDKTVAFWHRRQAHETSVHRWDLEPGDGKTPIDTVLAADGIDEFQEIFFGVADGAPPTAIELRATDVDRVWRFDVGDGDRARHTIEGAASDVLLTLWQRLPDPVWAAAVAAV